MSHYTNPAFCQKSEFGQHKNGNFSKSAQKDFFPSPVRETTAFQPKNMIVHNTYRQQPNQRPKPGPKALKFSINTADEHQNEGYALVPLNELPGVSKDRYAILPAPQARMLHSSSLKLSKSQDDLEFNFSEAAYEGEDSFTSLPVFSTHADNRKLIPAFSSDFINKSLTSLEQKGMQRYAIVPTDDDEDLVDSNHEIIEMYNGRAHRYAVIPTDDEERCWPVEYGIGAAKLNKSQSFGADSIHRKRIRYEIPPKSVEQGYSIADGRAKLSFNGKAQPSIVTELPVKNMPNTPTKNSNATQKLHELLSTPRKCEPERLQRCSSYQTIIHRSPNQIQLHSMNTSQNRIDFYPQKLNYESRATLAENIERRTTAVISPRLHEQMAFSDTNLCDDKQERQESFQKVENASATIGIISLMLIITGILNSGFSLYLVTDVSVMRTGWKIHVIRMR